MRVTGGKYRGKHMESSDDSGVRPTTSKMREVMFNLLQHGRYRNHEDFIVTDGFNIHNPIEDAYVLDLFCGSGALSIEALSRGAKHVTLVDQNRRTLSIARQNIANLGEEDNAWFLCWDSTRLGSARHPCHIVFIDPPYNKNLSAPALRNLTSHGWIQNGTLVVLELGKQDDVPTLPGFYLLDDRVHDNTRLSILQYHD